MKVNPRHLALWLLTSASLVTFMPALATVIQVYPEGVDGCHLREAITAANSNTATINCLAGSANDTLNLRKYPDHKVFLADNFPDSDEDNNVSGDFDVFSTITIQGVSPADTMIVATALDRAIDVRSPGNLTLNDVTVIGGSVFGTSANVGGVIYKRNGATVTINRSVLRGGNTTIGGGVYATGTGILTLSETTIQNNNANTGGGIVVASQPAGNEALFENLTVSGNTATSVGGIYADSGFSLRNSTVTHNKGGTAGGVVYGAQGNTNTINFANSLIVGNTNNDNYPADLACYGNYQLGVRAYTIIGANTFCRFVLTIGLPGNDVRLSPLFDFGSGRPTHALLAGSSALHAGNPYISTPMTDCMNTDARDVSRSRPCDIGAYEEHFDLTVNSFVDLPDLNPGDGICQANGNICTLRAAMMEASATGGRWFVRLPVGTYTLNRALNPYNDGEGGDIDIETTSTGVPIQVTLMGMGDADDTRIVSTGADRVLEVIGRRTASLNPYTYTVYPVAFALFNATLSGGDLSQEQYGADLDFLTPIGGGGIRVLGGKTLFYNVVVKDNRVESNPDKDVMGGGVYVDLVSNYSGSTAPPYSTSSQFERFAIIDNATTATVGGHGKSVGGLYARGPNSYYPDDRIILNNGTIAGNVSRDGGGVVLSNKVDASFLTIVNNISESHYQRAGGLTVSEQDNHIRNVLVAGNLADGVASDCDADANGFGASLVSLGYNLIQSPGSNCVISGDDTSNLLNVDPQLEAVRSRAGMPYIATAFSSPAVNAIPVEACPDAAGLGVLVDALGGSRRYVESNLACDIGAVEVSELPIFADGFDP